MDAPLESRAEEVARLRGCLNDLVSIMALPALWAGGEPRQIVSALLDALLEMLRLAFVFVRLNDPDGGPPTEAMRVSAPLGRIARARAIGEVLDSSLGDAPLEWPPSARVSIGDVDLSVAAARLGLEGEIGIVVAGSQRLGFPGHIERLLLDVATNQATLGLQQARLLSEQKRVARELDQRVARRTSELATANEQLKKEVAERKRAEEALRERERESRLIVDSIPGLVATLTPGGAVETVNRRVLDYCGRTLEELKQWGTSDTVHPEDLPRVIEIITRSMASGEPYEIEERIRRFDGVYRWFQVRGLPLRDSNARIVRWYVLLTDIDERKLAEDELRRSEALLAIGQRLTSTGTFSWRLDTDEITLSEELRRMYELEQGAVPTMERLFGLIHPEDIPPLVDKQKQIRADQAPYEHDLRLRMPDGRVKYVRSFGRVIRHEDGRLEAVGASQDLTHRRLQEEALDRLRSELAHVTRVMSLGALTASIAHEVNQPLSGIITNASTCLRTLDADPPNVNAARETARRIIRDGNRAADVITRLRALFTKKEFTAEPLDLNEAMREVISLSLSDLQRNRVVLQSELADDLPRVTGDRVQLQQVILNLLRNGSDAMLGVDDRPRQLLVRTERENGDRVRVTVRDAGIGVDRQSMDKVFDAFYTTKSAGMGIGLSVSRSIVERHHGRLWVEPNDGPGATFAFSIPCGPGA